MTKKNIAIFASGSGSNAEVICNYFKAHPNIEVCRIYSNNAKAGVIDRAKKLNIPCLVFKKTEEILDDLKEAEIELIVLAGYLKLIPKSLINLFPKRIVNIHPALLPKYGGKGMYGINVHKAAVANAETVTGITIHLVDENYDEGKHLAQIKTRISKNDTPEKVAQKVLILEHANYALTIEAYLMSL